MSTPSYPNISFNTSTVGPTPINRPWRDIIGVAAEFNKGPFEATFINNRQDFQRLYGEDNSAGSLAIQQAMSLGATRFFVSRAVPEDIVASASFSFASGNPNLAPLVGFESSPGNPQLTLNTANRTIGIELGLSYIGSPSQPRLAYADVTTDGARSIVNAGFNGRANVRLYVTKLVGAAVNGAKLTGATALEIKTALSVANQPQVAEITFPSDADRDAALPFLVAGNRIAASGVNVLILSAPTLTLFGGSTYAVLVQAAPAVVNTYVSAAGATSSGKIISVTSTVGLVVGATVTVTAGIGTFVAATQVSAIINATSFEATTTPSTPLSGGASVVTAGNTTAGTPAMGAPVAATINQPVRSQYIIGYRIDTLDNGSITSYTAGSSYFRYPNATFNDGYTNYELDSFYAIDIANTALQAFSYQALTSGNVLVPENFGNFGSAQGLGIKYATPLDSLVRLLPGGQITIPIAKGSLLVGDTSAGSSTAYQVGRTVPSIFQDLENSIYSSPTFSSLIGGVETFNVLAPFRFEFTTSVKGSEAARISLSIRAYTQTGSAADDLKVLLPQGVSYNNLAVTATALTLSGAQRGAQYAFRDFYSVEGIPLLRVEYSSPGLIGNSVRISIEPVSGNDASGRFNLTASYSGNSQTVTENFSLNNSEVDLQTGLYTATRSSALIRAYFLPIAEPAATSSGLASSVYSNLPLRQAPPLGRFDNLLDSGLTAVTAQGSSFVNSVLLTNGYDYDSLTRNAVEVRTASYLAAVKRLESKDVVILITPGISYGSAYDAVFSEVVKQVDAATAQSGLRIAVLEAPAGSSARQSVSLAAKLNSRRVVLVRGHARVVGLDGNPSPVLIGATGSYAGLKVIREPQISPPSAYGEVLLRSILSIDTPNTPEFFETVSVGNVEALIFDPGFNGFKFLNGRTTSNLLKDRYVTSTYIDNQVFSDLYQTLQWVRSEPNSPELWARIKQSCDAYMNQKLRDGFFTRISATICSSQNNRVTTNVVNIRLRATKVLPADIFNVDYVEDLNDVFDLTVNVASN